MCEKSIPPVDEICLPSPLQAESEMSAAVDPSLLNPLVSVKSSAKGTVFLVVATGRKEA